MQELIGRDLAQWQKLSLLKSLVKYKMKEINGKNGLGIQIVAHIVLPHKNLPNQKTFFGVFTFSSVFYLTKL